MSIRKNTYLKTLVYAILLFFPCLELALRLTGGTPYEIEPFSIKSVPENPFLPDSNMAFVLNNGQYNMTINGKVNFVATHSRKHGRYSGIRDTLCPVRIISGCSFTYGYGVDDNETFVALLNEWSDSVFYQNMGVPGYSTVQSLLQMKELVNQGLNIDKFVVVFSDFHFERNALSPSYRQALKIGFENAIEEDNIKFNLAQFPYNAIDNGFEICFEPWSELYHHWNGRETFALISAMQSFTDNWNEKRIKFVDQSFEIFLEMKKISNEYDLNFEVVMLDESERTNELKDKLEKELIKVNSISFDHNDLTKTNAPHDNHPNKEGHEFIAKKLFKIFNQNKE